MKYLYQRSVIITSTSIQTGQHMPAYLGTGISLPIYLHTGREGERESKQATVGNVKWGMQRKRMGVYSSF